MRPTRAQTIEVQSYQIHIDLTDGNGNPSSDTFHSTTTVTFTAQQGAQTFIDIVPGPSGALHSAVLNNAAIDVTGYDKDQGLPLTGLATHNTLVVEAHCTYSHDGEGLYRFEDLSDNQTYLYTQFETAAAKRVFACFDQPDLKASFELTVIAPGPWVVVANTTRRHPGRRKRQATQVHTDRPDQQLPRRPDRRALRRLVGHLQRQGRRHPAAHLLPRIAAGIHGS